MLFIGDDWAEDHHDIEVQDANGRTLRRARLPEGMPGIRRFGEIIGEFLPADDDAEDVAIGIETDRGPWVQALLAAGYQVYGIDPKQAHRHREILGSSGAKSDKGDAHALADMVRTRRHQLRLAGGDSEIADAVKVVTRTHQNMTWERTRHMLRLRAALREYFSAVLEISNELDMPLAGPTILGLLAKASTPEQAAKLTTRQLKPLLYRQQKQDHKLARIRAILRSDDHLGQPAIIASAYAVTVQSTVTVLTTIITQIELLETEVKTHFGRHPAAEILTSQPGMGPINGARVLAEFGDAPGRYRTPKARKNYAGTSPITRQSGRTRHVQARHVRNNRLADALASQALSALSTDPYARAYYDQQRARGVSHNAALRQLANRLVGILHGCLAHHTTYNQTTAWAQHINTAA